MTLHLKYVMKKELINSSNISKFVIDQKGRRKIRTANVKKLTKLMNGAKHFSSPFVVNFIQNKYKLIDGNHRKEAIEQCLLDNPKFEIYVWVAVYSELDEEQEREVYADWNSGTTQSATDFLKSNWEAIPFGKKILAELPVSIYPNTKTLSVKNLVGCQICAKRHNYFEGGYSAGRDQILIDFDNITLEDIELLKEFSEFMENCFGMFNKKTNSLFYGTTPLSVFYRIWFDNKHLKAGKLEKAFKQVFKMSSWSGDNSPAKAGGIQASKNFYAIVRIPLGNKLKDFKSDTEAVDEYIKQQNILKLVK